MTNKPARAVVAETRVPIHDPILVDLAYRFSNPLYGVRVLDRKKRTKCYERSLVGRDAVDWLYQNLELDNRGQAVALGSHLLKARLLE